MATDPRGLSGVVFNEMPLRDFSRDVAIGRQMKSQKEAAQAKALQDEYNEYSLENYKFGDITMPKHKKIFLTQIKPALREQSMKVVSLPKGSKERTMEEMRYDRMKEAALLFPAYSRRTDKDIEKNHVVVTSNIDNIGPESLESFNAQSAYHNKMIGSEGVYFDEEGNLIIDGQDWTSVMTVNRMLPPQKEPEIAIDRLLKRPEVDVQNFGRALDDGSIFFSPQKVSDFFEIEKMRGSDEYLDYLSDAIKNETGQTVSKEEAVMLAENKPSYIEEAEKLFEKDIKARFKDRPARKKDDSGKESDYDKLLNRVRPVSEEHKPFNDPSNETTFIVRSGIVVPDNVDVTLLDGTPARVQSVYDEVGGGTDTLYANVTYKDKDGDIVSERIKLGKEGVAQIETDLKLPRDKTLADLVNDVKPKNAPRLGENKQQETQEIEEFNINGEMYTKDELIGAGWTEEQLKELKGE